MQNGQEQILEVAGRFFLKYGIRAVSIDDICSELRISKKTFYQHFGSKEDLILALHNALMAEKKNLFAKIMDGKNAIQSLIDLSKEARKKIEANHELIDKDLKKYYPAIYEQVEKAHREQSADFFKKNLEKGIEEGFYREDIDIEFVAIFLFQNTQIASVYEELQKIDKKQYTKKKMMDLFFDLYLRVVVNDKGMAYYEEHYHK